MQSVRPLIAVVCVLATMVLPSTSQANPKGGQVKAGAATFESGPNSLTIRQSSDRGIIHWEDFSIGAGETTRFIQPSSSSATLNRVVGGIPSTIHGNLEANGQVYLINPNGILIGPTGRVNTATFVASTLDVPDAEFLAGSNMHFKGTSTAGVVNLGVITATNGDVILMGHTVQNAGTINAPNGVAALAAGDDILLQVAGDERVVVNSGIPTGGTGVLNSGTIQAAQAELKAAGGNVYALAVNNTGIVRATGISQKNGRVILGVAGGVGQNTGSLIAKNADGSGGHVRMASGKGGHTIQNGIIDATGTAAQKNGGTVELLGDTVSVGAWSLIDVSGSNAGLVAVGVDAATASKASATHGLATVTAAESQADPSQLTTAQQTAIEVGSRILANSTGAGNGGHVVVWSEQQSIVSGSIEANGGTLGGDGGLVETSGRFGLAITPGTKVSTTAPAGSAGTWLLDPAGITIDAGPTTATVSIFATPPAKDFNQNALTNHVAASDIVSALSGGSNVVVSTSNSYASKDIIVNADIVTGVYPNNTTTLVPPSLTLNSAGAIVINNAIGGPTTNVIFSMQALGGGITIAPTGSIVTSGISAYSVGDIAVQGLLSALNDKTIFLTSTTGNIIFSGIGKAQTTVNSTVYLETYNSATSTISDAGTTSIIAGGLAIYSGAKGVGTSASPLHTDVANLDVFVTDNGLTTGTGGGVFIKNTGGDLNIGGSDPNFYGNVSFSGVQVPTLPGFGGVEINNTAGDLLAAISGDVVTASGNIKLTAGTGHSIKILTAHPNSVRSYNGSTELDAGADVLVGNAANWGANVRGETSVLVQAGGNVIVSGSLLKAGGGSGLTVTAGGNITVQQALGFAGEMGTSGGAAVNLTTGAGCKFTNDVGNGGGVSTTLADDLNGTVTSSGASIHINTDSIVLNAPLNAGTNGTVDISPLGVHTAINLGTTAKNVVNELGLSSAELNEITAGNVNLFTQNTDDGIVHVTAAIDATGASLTQLVLEAGGGGGVVIAQPLNLGPNALVLNAFNNGAVTGSGNISADSITVTVPGAGVNLTGIINTQSLTFNTHSTAQFTNGSNQIDKIETSQTGAQGITVCNTGSLILDGVLTTTAGAVIKIGGDLTINLGAGIAADGTIDLDVTQGHLVNLAVGANVLNAGAGQRYIVWSSQLGAGQKGGLTGSDYTSSGVTPFSDPLAAGNVFYYANLTAPAAPSQSYAILSLPRLFVSIPPPTPGQALLDFRHYLGTLSLTDLVALTADPTVMSDPIKANELLSQVNVLNTYAFKPLSQDEQDAIVAQAAIDIQAKADSLLAEKQAVLSAKLYPTVLDMNDPAVMGAFSGFSIEAMAAKVNLGSFSLDQLQFMSRDELLAMLGSAGVKLGPDDAKVAASATMTQDQLGSIIKSGNGLDPNQFASLIAAGGGNLSVNQIISAGGGNLISQDGGGFSVVDRFGKVISNDGGSMSVFDLAKVISNDGGSVVSHDGGSVISNDGGSLIGEHGNGLLGSVVGLISQDGGGILAARAQLIGASGSTLIGASGSTLIGASGSTLIGASGSTLIGASGSTLIGEGGGGVISHNGSAVISHNGSAITIGGASSLMGPP